VTQLALARSLIANGNVERANQVLTNLQAAQPRLPAIRVLLGKAAAARRDEAGARRHFSDALVLDPDNLEALSSLVSLDLAAHQPQAARTRVDDRVSKSPKDSNVLLLAGRVHAVTGDVPGAEQLLQRAIEADSNNLQAYAALGQLFISEHRMPEARERFEQIIAKRPDSVPAQTMVAMLYEAEQNRSEARKRYERVMQIDQDAAVAANNLAWMYTEDGGNLDVALQLAQTAKRELPNRPEIDNTLGWVYYKKGLASLAICPLRSAADQEPSNPTYFYQLGLAYVKAGDKVQAKKALQRALTLNGSFAGADDARKALAAL